MEKTEGYIDKTERYIKARQYLGLTPTWIAKNTGISRPTIKKAETIKDYFSPIYTLFLVKKGISADWLEKNKGPMIIKKSDCEEKVESLRNEISLLKEKTNQISFLMKENSVLHQMIELQKEKIEDLKKQLSEK